MKNTAGFAWRLECVAPNERFQIANIISLTQNRIFDPIDLFKVCFWGNRSIIALFFMVT